MPRPYQLDLSAAQRTELQQARDHHPKPYVRERAAAILKVAAGQSLREVGRQGLLRPRQHRTLSRWIRRYRAEGLAGLLVRPCRGRKPAVTVSGHTRETSRPALLEMLHQDPYAYDHDRARWTLALLGEHLGPPGPRSRGSVWRFLDRLRIGYKRARQYVHSPDPDYQAKVARIQEALERTRAEPERYVFLYLDEHTYFRQPTQERAYEAVGHTQPLARRSLRSNRAGRVVAVVDAVRGRVLWEQGAHVTASTLSTLYTRLQAAYPQAETIYVAQDNWPVHFHPNVLVGLAPQDWPWPFNRPPNWSAEATIAAPKTTLHIQLLGLPTYASWLNPVEKLWRWLQQDVTHLHRLADDWTALQQRIADFLNRFTADSPDLLQYVGLGAHN